jgi:hypothetical protein
MHLHLKIVRYAKLLVHIVSSHFQVVEVFAQTAELQVLQRSLHQLLN